MPYLAVILYSIVIISLGMRVFLALPYHSLVCYVYAVCGGISINTCDQLFGDERAGCAAFRYSVANMSQLMRLCYLSHRQPAKAQASLRIHAVSPEPSLFAHMKYVSRRRVRQTNQISSTTEWLHMRV